MCYQNLKVLAQIMKKFKIYVRGPLAPKRGPQTKKFQRIRYKGPKNYVLPKFEGPSLNNEKVQNFDHFGPPSSFFGGP